MAPIRKDTTRGERVSKFRRKLYSIPMSHAEFKVKDALRKRASRASAAPLTELEREEQRKKARDLKRKSRESKKSAETLTNDNNRSKVKNALRRQRRRLVVKLTPMGESTPKRKAQTSKTHTASNLTPLSPSPSSSLARTMWSNLTPNSRKKMKLNILNDSESGINHAFRKELGVNLSNDVSLSSGTKTAIEERVEEFFNNEYVSRVTPDIRKTSQGVPIRYALGNFKTLHEKFISTEGNCSYETFHCVVSGTFRSWVKKL